MNKGLAKGIAKISLIVFALALVGFFVLRYFSPVSAAHDANVTIYPNIANCNELGNTFTINVYNNGPDSLLQVEIYKALAGISNFECGPAPTGWTLFSYEDRCIYVTGLNSSYKIAPGSSLNFTFNATMSSESCASIFTVVTVDDKRPSGDRKTYDVIVLIDCVPPSIMKTVGQPNIPGSGFDYWVTSNTPINITASDNTDECDLGLDYCRWRVTLDGTIGDWNYVENEDTLSWIINLLNDSNHYLEVECYDIAKNKAALNETDKVDNTPPVTTKQFNGPHHSVNGVEWINGVTTVTLNPTDPDPSGHQCNVGVEKTWYVDALSQNEEPCWDPTNYCKPVCDNPYDTPENVECINNVQEYCTKNWEEENFTSWEDCVEDYVYEGCEISCNGSQWKLYRGVPIPKGEESCHILQFFSVDYLGNVEDMKVNCFFVDKTPPKIEKEVGKPRFEGDGETFDWWVTQNTPITLKCKDIGPHPSNNVTIYWKYTVDNGTPVEGKYKGEEYTLYFQEDSVHELEFWCKDAVEKESVHDKEIFKVDTTPPSITKTMIGEDHLGECPPTQQGNVCYVKGDRKNGVRVDVKDDGKTCAVGGITCEWGYYWNNSFYGWYNETEFPFDIIFDKDSEHKVHIKCWDALGNEIEDIETFLVDSTPPTTTKTYGQPFYTDGYADWITSKTPINLTATDAKVGVNKTYYRFSLVNDSYCWDYSNCQSATGSGNFLEYSTPFTIPNDSCHLIEYYSVDKLGNEETVKKQCVFVDNTKPKTWVEVGEPKIPCDPEDPTKCDYWISNATPINISCEDQGNHPVDNSHLYYRYKVDDGEWTQWIDPNGYEAHKKIIFEEDSVHYLQYYCVDALGNSDGTAEQPYEKVYKVDSTPPNITKTISEPKVKCIEEENCDWWITQDTEITLTAEDGGEICAVGGVKCYYRYKIDNGNWTDWAEYTGPFKFNEDSVHYLQYYCVDALGNEGPIQTEIDKVDSTPPTTRKAYGQPFYTNGTHDWIAIITPINLTATDGGESCHIGSNFTKYRYCLYEGCYESEEPCSCPEGTPWLDYKEPFTIPNDSEHCIEFYSEDKLGNKEAVKSQCVYVDNKPPIPIKRVGEPKTKWDGKDAKYYNIADKCWNESSSEYMECWKVTLFTPITLDCKDEQPHPVGHEETCFKVEWDGNDTTEEYCRVVNGTYNKYEDGFCCGLSAPYEFHFNEETEHNLKYYCVDYLGNKGPIDEEKFKVEGTKFEIKINKKWNLISVPFVMLDNSIEEVFKDIKEDIISVWTYDSENNLWLVYSPGEGPDSLTEMVPGWGYWVLAKKDTMLVIGGSLFKPAVTPPDKKVVKGWNLIGYFGTENQTGYYGPFGNGKKAYCALYSLVDTTVGYPKWSALLTYWEPYNPYQW
ncbi:MAG: hypothetical protein QXP32_09650, partial [Nitrososphaeria archaeon]